MSADPKNGQATSAPKKSDSSDQTAKKTNVFEDTPITIEPADPQLDQQIRQCLEDTAAQKFPGLTSLSDEQQTDVISTCLTGFGFQPVPVEGGVEGQQGAPGQQPQQQPAQGQQAEAPAAPAGQQPTPEGEKKKPKQQKFVTINSSKKKFSMDVLENGGNNQQAQAHQNGATEEAVKKAGEELEQVLEVATNTFRKKKNNSMVPPKGMERPKMKSMKHTFKWAFPMTLNKTEKPEDYMLIKGVAMTAGTAKRGEVHSKENVIYASGAMSAWAMAGLAVIDIDHFEKALPKEYEDKYPGISDPYPSGFIIDAAADENEIELDGKKEKVWQVEYVAALINPKVYEMVKKGEFVGNSVVDYFRKQNCDCGHKGKECTCDIEGSHYLRNTLVLNGVPNSDGTWVAPVTEDDVGTILVRDEIEAAKNAAKPTAIIKANLLRKVHTIKQAYDESAPAPATPEEKPAEPAAPAPVAENSKTETPTATPAPVTEEPKKNTTPEEEEEEEKKKKKAAEEAAAVAGEYKVVVNGEVVTEKTTVEQIKNLLEKKTKNTAKYSLDGIWTTENGLDVNTPERLHELVDFLMEKGMSHDEAHDVANYLSKNPKALSREQLEYLSAMDLVAWWTHKALKNTVAVVGDLRRHTAIISRLKHVPGKTFGESLNILEEFKQKHINAKLLSQGEANYRLANGGNACIGCRWFTPENYREDSNEEGYCLLVKGEIMGHHVCDRYESLAEAVTRNTTTTTTPTPAPEATAPEKKENTVTIKPEESGIVAPKSTAYIVDPAKSTDGPDTEREVALMSLAEKEAFMKKLEQSGVPGMGRIDANNYNKLRTDFMTFLRSDIEKTKAAKKNSSSNNSKTSA